MPSIQCRNCRKEFIANGGKARCPFCEIQSAGTDDELFRLPSDGELERNSNIANQAIGQAKILDKFGEAMQLVGYIVIGILTLGSVIALTSSQWILFGICLVSIPLTFAYFNVFGSAFRAIGLYIQIKVK